MQTKIRISLVEDHPEFREVISLVLQNEPDFELINSFGSAERALRKFENATGIESSDIVILDLNLPEMSGLEALPWIQTYQPNAKIIILSQSDSEADIIKAIELGASGYLLKASEITQIADAIRSVANGGASLDPKVAKYILQHLTAKPVALEIAKPLSKREMEILRLISEGMLKKQIAHQLGISLNTVVRHIVHIYEKLEVQNAAAAVTKGYRSGIL